MTAENVKNWLKEQLKLGEDQIAVGGIDGNKPTYIGVYDGKTSGKQRICIGGRKNTKYQERAYTILVHWTSSAVEASAKAMEVSMDGIHVVSADPGKQPEWAGRDDRRICEYVIRLSINYERNESNG